MWKSCGVPSYRLYLLLKFKKYFFLNAERLFAGEGHFWSSFKDPTFKKLLKHFEAYGFSDEGL